MFLPILEYFVIFLIITTAITQLVIPLWKNRPIFPIFNRRRSELENRLTFLNELEDEQSIEKIVKELETKLDNIMKENDHE